MASSVLRMGEATGWNAFLTSSIDPHQWCNYLDLGDYGAAQRFSLSLLQMRPTLFKGGRKRTWQSFGCTRPMLERKRSPNNTVLQIFESVWLALSRELHSWTFAMKFGKVTWILFCIGKLSCSTKPFSLLTSTTMWLGVEAFPNGTFKLCNS